MTIKIAKKIVKYSVEKPEEKAEKEAAQKASAEIAAAARASGTEPEMFKDRSGRMAKVIRMHESVERPECLVGSTFKIKTPVSDHAMYVTINDIILNEGTEYEQRRPFEIFINSKNLDHFQWIVALTRIISAVFRKGGDVTFLVDELKAVFDPRGGAWMGGRYVPSLLAAIGDVIERHMIDIGFMPERHDTRHEIAERRQVVNLPDSGRRLAQCPRCDEAALIRIEGCDQCTSCNYSKCG